MKHLKRVRLSRVVAATASSLAMRDGGVSAGVSSAGASAKITISVAYAANTTFDTTPLGHEVVERR